MTDHTIRQSLSDEQIAASRRELVAAAVTVAAAAGATSAAQAQPSLTVRRINPPGMTSPRTYHQVVEVNGPHRVVYIAGQAGEDATGKVAQGFRAQAVQVLDNIKTALASVGGGFEHVVKHNAYLTDIEANAEAYREVRQSFFTDRAALPAGTLVQVPRLANPAFLIEVEVVAVLAQRV
jgi:enamine deaminase RidA (YjgF/YER057c/UK114 family)